LFGKVLPRTRDGRASRDECHVDSSRWHTLIIKLQRWEERRDEIEALVRQVFGGRAAVGRMEKITEQAAVVSRS
jgi:hypothetical protein